MIMQATFKGRGVVPPPEPEQSPRVVRHTYERAQPNYNFQKRKRLWEQQDELPLVPAKRKPRKQNGIMLEAANLPAFKRSEKDTNSVRPNSERSTYIKNG